MQHHAKPRPKLFSSRTVMLAIIALVLGISVYNLNASRLLGNKLPMPLGYGASVVMSGSMEPTLKVDDLVFIKKTKDIKVDDIIVFQSGNSLVIHRVIKIDGDGVTTKGDANNAEDEPIKLKDVKGVMVGRIPFVGILVDFIKQPIVVIILLVGAFLLTEKSYRKEKQKDSDELKEIELEIKKLLEETRKNQESEQ